MFSRNGLLKTHNSKTQHYPPITQGDLIEWTTVTGPNIGDVSKIFEHSLIPTISFTQVESGYGFILALDINGLLWAWGYNYNGELGVGGPAWNPTPTMATDGTAWKYINAGHSSSFGITTTGELYGWGENGLGYILGIFGDNNNKFIPTLVSANNWIDVSCGVNTTLGITSDGTLWGWGYGTDYMAPGTYTNAISPVVLFNGTKSWKSIEVGQRKPLSGENAQVVWQSTVIGIDSGGAMWGWGNNQYGLLGNGTNNDTIVTSPTQILPETAWESVSIGPYHVLGIKQDGSLWSWGNNQNGQLGDGTTISKNSPVCVLPGTTWKKCVAHDRSSFAIKSDNTLWMWGYSSELPISYAMPWSISIITTPCSVIGGGQWADIAGSNADSNAVGIRQSMY